jgi:hypothetical protein
MDAADDIMHHFDIIDLANEVFDKLSDTYCDYVVRRSDLRLVLRRRRRYCAVSFDADENSIDLALYKVAYKSEAFVGSYRSDVTLDFETISLYDPQCFDIVEEFVDCCITMPQYGDRGYAG